MADEDEYLAEDPAKRARKRYPKPAVAPVKGKHPPGMGRGRAFAPSDDQRRQVELMVSLGSVSQEEVAEIIGVSLPTFKKHFAKEIRLGKAKCDTAVGANIIRIASDKKNGKGTVQAAIFYAKTRMGWKETTRNEHTGADGAPLPLHQTAVVILPSNGRDDESNGEEDE
jgi:hypothetical protein